MSGMQDLILYTLAAGSVFLLAFLSLANPKGSNDAANKWLGIFLFSFGCALLERALFSNPPHMPGPAFTVLTELSRFAIAPALYLSVLNFTSPGRTFKKVEYLHFFPFLLFALCSLIAFFSSPHVSPVLPPALGKVLGVAMFLSVKIQIVVYWLLSYSRLIRHRRNIRKFASTTATIDLRWLQYFLWALVFMIFLWFNELFFGIAIIKKLAPFGYLVAVYFIGYFSLRQQEVFRFEKREVEAIREILEEGPVSTAKTPRLSEEAVATLKEKMQSIMEHDKAFLDQELDLPQLARRLHISSHDLSYLLNAGFEENFFQFVNRYRVAEAKILLLSPKHRHLNVLGIAYEAGFSSKTTFNTTFKKFTGQSPTQFQRNATGEVQLSPPAHSEEGRMDVGV
jgi:AraC-like DNA-binding protein